MEACAGIIISRGCRYEVKVRCFPTVKWGIHGEIVSEVTKRCPDHVDTTSCFFFSYEIFEPLYKYSFGVKTTNRFITSETKLLSSRSPCCSRATTYLCIITTAPPVALHNRPTSVQLPNWQNSTTEHEQYSNSMMSSFKWTFNPQQIPAWAESPARGCKCCKSEIKWHSQWQWSCQNFTRSRIR